MKAPTSALGESTTYADRPSAGGRQHTVAVAGTDSAADAAAVADIEAAADIAVAADIAAAGTAEAAGGFERQRGAFGRDDVIVVIAVGCSECRPV